MRRLILACMLLSGCALERDYIEVRHVAAPGVQAIPGASEVVVSVDTRDGRTIRDRVSNKINGYGMEMAPIISTNDVITETQRAIVEELTSRGFRIGGSEARLDVEVLRFFSQFQTGFFAGSAKADLSVNVRLTDRSGRLVLAKTFTAEGIVPSLQLASGANARLALEDGLRKLIRMIGDDVELAQALLRAGPAGRPVS
ncbi:YajG family lipoprotein [Falsiroseomonas sp. E2-1-a20]|uniref:YajG family lipoprotein n=1 Tax=Falsiroseomonas sp. E2-1-a20 TaxID=3239300 RepID=UPI003F2E5A4E